MQREIREKLAYDGFMTIQAGFDIAFAGWFPRTLSLKTIFARSPLP